MAELQHDDGIQHLVSLSTWKFRTEDTRKGHGRKGHPWDLIVRWFPWVSLWVTRILSTRDTYRVSQKNRTGVLRWVTPILWYIARK